MIYRQGMRMKSTGGGFSRRVYIVVCLMEIIISGTITSHIGIMVYTYNAICTWEDSRRRDESRLITKLSELGACWT